MKRGFTLIELLVTIAIISILAAMLMPVISKSKNNASKATDINNLKQIMVALHTYSSDADDVLPLPNWDNGGYFGLGGTNAGWLYKADMAKASSDPLRYNGREGLLWPILQSPQVYLCPMDRPLQARESAALGGMVQRRQQLSSYAMNGAVIGFSRQIYPPVKLAAMRPTDCAFWETDETEPYFFNDGANSPDEGVSARHYQGAIQSAFDGSVNYIKLDKWYDEVQDNGKNRLWCYPGSEDGR